MGTAIWNLTGEKFGLSGCGGSFSGRRYAGILATPPVLGSSQVFRFVALTFALQRVTFRRKSGVLGYGKRPQITFIIWDTLYEAFGKFAQDNIWFNFCDITIIN
jgi:hypothetical protein